MNKIAEPLLEQIRQTADEFGVDNVVPVLGDAENPSTPRGPGSESRLTLSTEAEGEMEGTRRQITWTSVALVGAAVSAALVATVATPLMIPAIVTTTGSTGVGIGYLMSRRGHDPFDSD